MSNQVKAVHFRMYTKKWDDETGPWRLSQRGGITIVAEIRDGEMFFGAAFCSMKDIFCKKTGYQLALERARLTETPFGVMESDFLVEAIRSLTYSSTYTGVKYGLWKDRVEKWIEIELGKDITAMCVAKHDVKLLQDGIRTHVAYDFISGTFRDILNHTLRSIDLINPLRRVRGY